ncbi:hypothetical protein L0Y69_02970 [bacterium]|nr:hypothetical protein [bacterium]
MSKKKYRLWKSVAGGFTRTAIVRTLDSTRRIFEIAQPVFLTKERLGAHAPHLVLVR